MMSLCFRRVFPSAECVSGEEDTGEQLSHTHLACQLQVSETHTHTSVLVESVMCVVCIVLCNSVFAGWSLSLSYSPSSICPVSVTCPGAPISIEHG